MQSVWAFGADDIVWQLTRTFFDFQGMGESSIAESGMMRPVRCCLFILNFRKIGPGKNQFIVYLTTIERQSQ